ncbi:uncharacterized protein LOC144730822 [Lampetra planeri]
MSKRAVSTLLLLLLSTSCWCRPPRHFHRHHHVTRVCDNLNLLSCFTSALQVRLNKSLETYKAAQGLLHQYPNLNIPVMTLPGVPLPNIIKVARTHMGPRPRDQICCLYRTLAAFLHLLDVLVEDQRGSSGSEAVRSDLQTFKRDLVDHVNLLRVVSDQLEEERRSEEMVGDFGKKLRGLQVINQLRSWLSRGHMELRGASVAHNCSDAAPRRVTAGRRR